MPLSRLNFPFLTCPPPRSVGSAHPAGPGGLVPPSGPCPSTLWPIWADALQCRPLSLYPLADKELGPVWGPYRSTLWSFRRLSLYPLADSGRFVAILTLIALPFGHFGVLGPLLSYSFQVFKFSHVPSWPRRGKLLAPPRGVVLYACCKQGVRVFNIE